VSIAVLLCSRTGIRERLRQPDYLSTPARQGRNGVGASYSSFTNSHKRTASSMPALAKVLLSGVKATAAIPLRWPRRVTRSLPVAGSHNFTVSSPLPLANVLPSEENAKQ